MYRFECISICIQSKYYTQILCIKGISQERILLRNKMRKLLLETIINR